MKRNGLTCGALLLSIALVACAPKEESIETAVPVEQPAADQPEAPAPVESQPGETAPEATMDIAGKVWLVDEIAGEKILTPADARQPFIQFDAAKKFVNGFLGCNTFRGGYESDGKTLKFGALASTKMACQGDRDKVEFAMNQALVKVTGFEIQGKQLTLTAADGTAQIRCHARNDQ